MYQKNIYVHNERQKKIWNQETGDSENLRQEEYEEILRKRTVLIT